MPTGAPPWNGDRRSLGNGGCLEYVKLLSEHIGVRGRDPSIVFRTFGSSVAGGVGALKTREALPSRRVDVPVVGSGHLW